MSLMCFVTPLRGDPQQGYWTNYVAHNPPRPRFQPIEAFPDQYSAPSIQRPPTYAAPYGTNPFPSYESKYFQSEPIRYPISIPEAKHLQEERFDDYPDFAPSAQEDEGVRKEWVNFEPAEKTKSNPDDEIIAKMVVLDKMLSEDAKDSSLHANTVEDKIMPEETKRVARQIRKQRPGFFWTLARVTFEAFNDTRSAIQQISNLINTNIVPDSATESSRSSDSLTVVSSSATGRNMTTANATESSTTEPTTTTAAPVLTRSGLQTLIRRNVLGLVRLFNIEWSEALNQSDVNVREFQNNLGNQVGTYLQDNPNAY